MRWEKEGWKMQALRVLEHRYDLPVDGMPGVFPIAGVPHCDQHENRATIYNPNAIGNRDFNVRFRSYSYWQDFRAANRLT